MSIPKDCKRLAEVDFPIAKVSEHAVREKSGPTGHISTLHLWWARRPLASSRAVLLALLLPDPCDPLCPRDFIDKSREILGQIQHVGITELDLRNSLLKFIADFSSWDLAANPQYLVASQALLNSIYVDGPPLVIDTFAGGGSIPLEGIRLGADAFASDINPVAGMILKVLLENIPRYGEQLADEIKQLGNEVLQEVGKSLHDFYPTDPDGNLPFVYLWARTIRCEAPNCGAEIPIYKTGWLNRKAVSTARYFKEDKNGDCEVLLIDEAPIGGPVKFRIAKGFGSEDAKPGYIKISGTKASGNNANVICPCCQKIVPGNKNNPRTSIQLFQQKGGADVLFDASGNRIGGSTLLAVATTHTGKSGKRYRLPNESDYRVIYNAQMQLSDQETKANLSTPSIVPDEPLPPLGTLGFRVQRYGMQKWGDLYTARQKLALTTFISVIKNLQEQGKYRKEAFETIALAFSRVALSTSSVTNWNASSEKMQHAYGRGALPMVWDFAEVIPIRSAPGSWNNAVDLIQEVISVWPSKSLAGQVEVSDATKVPLPNESGMVWFTDPPYYNAIPYADLSDLFFVWLKRVLPKNAILRDPYDPTNPLTPKTQEAVQDETKFVNGLPKDKNFFQNRLSLAFSEGRRILKEEGIGCIVFAHKTTEGWEALLSGIVNGGWTVTCSWPISTEMKSRLRARESAALSTSVHLICRPRPKNALVGDWGMVSRELPKRVREWMARLQSEGILGADLVFACIGPALEIYSRYSKVVDAEDREIPLGGDPEAIEPHKRGYLAYVWEVVGRTALEQVLGTSENASGSLEEDSRLTALFLWTLQSNNNVETKIKNSHTGTGDEEEEDEDDEVEARPKKSKGGYWLVYDVARRFAQPLGIHLPDWENRIIEIEKGIVHLYPVSERAQQLFGEEGAQAFANDLNRDPAKAAQLSLFPDAEPTPRPARVRATRKSPASVQETTQRREATTLDRLHAAMLLQKSGQSSALRALLQEENERGSDFMRLANALSALYPRDSEEKRLLDALLVNIRR